MTLYIGNDRNFYVTDEVSKIKPYQANTSWSNRYTFVTDLAAISRGKYESGNPSLRFQHLLKEASTNIDCNTINNGGLHTIKSNGKIASASRPLEFLPVVLKFEGNKIKLLDSELEITNYNFFKHTYHEGNKIYTNFRHIYNWLVHVENKTVEEALTLIPFNTEEELKDFKAIRVSSPFIVWAQLMTHTQLSKESQSDRVSTNNSYWLPSDLITKIKGLAFDLEKYPELEEFYKGYTTGYFGPDTQKLEHDTLVDIFLNKIPQNRVQKFLQDLGYKREIYSRAPYYFKYKEMVMTGWANDPETWGHLILEREAFPEHHKSWVQKETADTAKAIADIILSNEKE